MLAYTFIHADELKAVQANPAVVSLAIFLSAAAQHLHMKPFTLASLEVRC
jgi:hypothetical protein